MNSVLSYLGVMSHNVISSTSEGDTPLSLARCFDLIGVSKYQYILLVLCGIMFMADRYVYCGCVVAKLFVITATFEM